MAVRLGKVNKYVKKVSDKPLPSYNWYHSCHCLKCNCWWYLDESLYCPDCGGSHTYEVVEPIGGYDSEG